MSLNAPIVETRFHKLNDTPSHPIQSQLRFGLALCVHNFILSYGQPENTELEFLLDAKSASIAENTSIAVDANNVRRFRPKRNKEQLR